MPGLAPPFRADHVGSLLRPPGLLEMRRRFAEGEIEREALREAEDAAIREVVAFQEDIGLRAVTDGEFRRASFHTDVLRHFEGLVIRPGEGLTHFRKASTGE